MSLDLTGIQNRGEFYSHHYLDALLERDLKPLLERWTLAEAQTPPKRPPHNLLNGLAARYFQARSEASELGSLAPEERLRAAQPLHCSLLEALGYARTPGCVALDQGEVLPVAHVEERGGRPYLWVMECGFPEADDDDPLAQAPLRTQLPADAADATLPEGSWRELLDKTVFRQEAPPTWVLLLAGREVLLTHAHKWGRGKALAFTLDDLFARRQAAAFQAMAGLLHRDALCPDDGASLHDALDEASHKHAFSVSTDLREGAQQAIELLGNEAVFYLRTVRRRGILGGSDSAEEVDPTELTRECLTWLYRLIFLFYVESRSEDLGVAPMRSDAYRLGYSLESLRALESVPLTTPQAQDGAYLDASLRKLFRLVNQGCGDDGQVGLLDDAPSAGFGFRIPGLHSRLFDDAFTPILAKVKLRNTVLQRIIELLSLSREGAHKERGRISYAQLGINQLGAVYEGLLSYTGFFAREALLEVVNPGERGSDDARTFFVPISQRDRYRDDELVLGPDGARVEHPRGAYLYRLAGRDREKSASYYTPEVLTRCLVQYTLRERIRVHPTDANWVSADALLRLRVCEPAMGSGAFLNEVVNQLAEAYLARKQAELASVPDAPTLSSERYPRELQRVRARIAADQVYGVDLNPLAAELGKISLWLNVLRPGAPAPFFDGRIATGNSLIGARRQGYPVDHLHKSTKAKPNWLDLAPVELGPVRAPDHVYHWLLPAAGMAPFDSDNVVKTLLPEPIALIKAWKKQLNTAWKPAELARLRALSERVDALWTAHAAHRDQALAACTLDRPVWPEPDAPVQPGRDEESLAQAWVRHQAANTHGRRLKAAMDYWCAAWFWPLLHAADLPDRAAWLDDLEALLVAAPRADLATADDPQARRLRLAAQVAERQRFFHWEWHFPEVFAAGGFDVIVGNPPWVKLQWNEGGILSDLDPRQVIRRLSAKQQADARRETLASPDALASYLAEYEELDGAKSFLNSVANYPLLQGVQTNLYKGFLSLAWTLLATQGTGGMFHQAGIFDDPRGGVLRAETYQRLRFAGLAKNQLKLFDGVHHERPYCFTVWAGQRRSPDFRYISNLFHPRTLDDSLAHDGLGEIPGIKNLDGDWDLRGHRSRVVHVNEATLALFAKLYDPPGTPAREARLPVVHSAEILSVLRKLAAAPRKLGGLQGEYFATVCFDETYAQRDGTIRRETRFATSPAEWVVSGPHFYVGTPFNKTPNEGCSHNQDYSPIDLMTLPADYLPRTNYVPACDAAEYERRTPHWEGVPVTRLYRHVHRRMAPPTGERTLAIALVPPGMAHTHTVISAAYSSSEELVESVGLFSSIVYDFFLKTTGKNDIYESTLAALPRPAGDRMLRRTRALRLNCLTTPYADLWAELYTADFAADRHTKVDPRLPDWSHLGPAWTWDTPLRSPFARRQALVELDALAALALGLSADELCLIYRVQFPVLMGYEADTWYDQRGRIAFTNNRGLTGVGLDRKSWEALRGEQVAPHRYAGVSPLPDEAVDALGPYQPPFDRCDREDDMREAYGVFAGRTEATNGV